MSELPADWADLTTAARRAGHCLTWRREGGGPPRAVAWPLSADGFAAGPAAVVGDGSLAAARARFGRPTPEDTMMDDYQRFLESKHERARPTGFALDPATLPDRPFPWQRDVVAWAARQGRAAIFADTGLGKTTMELCWADAVARHTGGRVLLAAPLAVAPQTIAEAATMGLGLTYVRSQAEAEAAAGRLCITNYDRIGAFQGDRWAGVVLDESSILKSFNGATKQALVREFAATPYRLAATATPAPNDHIELGNHAEFLGVMPSNEMLMRWFINDSMKAGGYRLKGHAEADYWRWVASWAACVSSPADLGYSAEGYALPELDVRLHTIAADYDQLMRDTGSFAPAGTSSATRLWRDKAATAAARCARAAEIVLADPGEPWIVWVSTDAEADLMRAALPAEHTVEVRGSDRPEVKEARLAAFTAGQARYIITKIRIAGYGLNWQHCARQVFVGITYSFEDLYQALRRSWRFRQARPVVAHLIVAETESTILAVIAAKQEAHRQMQARMRAAMAETGLLAARDHSLRPYHATLPMRLPPWLASRPAA